jgi:hypothetical protein
MKKTIYSLLLYTLIIFYATAQEQLQINLCKNKLYTYKDNEKIEWASKIIYKHIVLKSYKVVTDTMIVDSVSSYAKDFDIKVVNGWAKHNPVSTIALTTKFQHDDTLFIVKKVKISYTTRRDVENKSTQRVYTDTSVLATGKWVKVRLNSDGIYKLTYEDLVNMGFSSPQNVKIYGYSGGQLSSYVDSTYIDDLPEVPIVYATGSDGVFNSGDYVLFYAQSPNSWTWQSNIDMMIFNWNVYDSYSYYFITCDQGQPSQIQIESLPNGSPTDTAVEFLTYSAHDVQSENLTHSGNLWVGESFDYRTPTRYFNLNFSDLDLSKPIRSNIYVVARSAQTTTFTVKLNNSLLTSISISPYGQYSFGNYNYVVSDAMVNSDNLQFSITYNYPDYDSKGWLNFIDVNAYRKLIYRGGMLSFNNIPYVSDTSFIVFKIRNTTSYSPVLWDVTNPLQVKKIEYQTQGDYLVFADSAKSIKKYVLFDGTVYKVPEYVSSVSNQNLHAIADYDLIIISHPNFMSYANEVADLHREKDGLDVGVFDVTKIYNEFASGRKEAAAIRNFLKMFYDRANNDLCKMPRYVLLFGDGSFDNKNNFTGNTNFIPTFEWGNSLNLTSTLVADDFYVLLDEGEGGVTGYIDMGIGRFPVKNKSEAEIAVKKLKHYYDPSTFGSWRTRITFIADDEDNGLHLNQANSIADYVMTNFPEFNVKKIFLDAYQQINTPSGESYPEANTAVNNVINNGTLIMNYTGHGNERGLAAEYVVSTAEMNQWKNYDKMPLFITASCEFAPFDNYEVLSAGESLFLNDRGGAIALLATTRLSSAGQNATLNMAFYQNAFTHNFSQRLGDIYMGTKWMAGMDYNKRKFALLGDPAMRLAYPQYRIVTDSIPDTLSSTGLVTIHGKVTDFNANLLNDFNGVIYPTVYDKLDTVQTLGNDESSPIIKFAVRDKILYKGKASVKNGLFHFSFVVPVDISYKNGFGKISYYANSDYLDAMGYQDSVVIYGIDSNGVEDDMGPDIRLYMNDTSFEDGE